ncbi:MAG: hypothetical protein HY390_07950, partial [Deltaproteobacteria bacterium]|nr:hypothetical protein [Deltaproteobacteria bacterium]
MKYFLSIAFMAGILFPAAPLIHAEDSLNAYGVSFVFYNNRHDFDKSESLHNQIFEISGIPDSKRLHIPIDAPFLLSVGDKKSIVSYLKELNERIRIESKGHVAKAHVQIILSSHGSSAFIGRQNQNRALVDGQTIKTLEEDLDRSREKLKELKKNEEKNAAEIFDVQLNIQATALLMMAARNSNRETFEIIDEPAISWQAFLDALYLGFDPGTSLEILVETCHSGVIIESLEQNRTNVHWKNRNAVLVASNAADHLGIGNVFLESFIDAATRTEKKVLNLTERLALFQNISYRAAPASSAPFGFERVVQIFTQPDQIIVDKPHIFRTESIDDTQDVSSRSILEEHMPKMKRTSYVEAQANYPKGMLPSTIWVKNFGKEIFQKIADKKYHEIPDLKIFSTYVSAFIPGSWGQFLSSYYQAWLDNPEKKSTESDFDLYNRKAFELDFIYPQTRDFVATLHQRSFEKQDAGLDNIWILFSQLGKDAFKEFIIDEFLVLFERTLNKWDELL